MHRFATSKSLAVIMTWKLIYTSIRKTTHDVAIGTKIKTTTRKHGNISLYGLFTMQHEYQKTLVHSKTTILTFLFLVLCISHLFEHSWMLVITEKETCQLMTCSFFWKFSLEFDLNNKHGVSILERNFVVGYFTNFSHPCSAKRKPLNLFNWKTCFQSEFQLFAKRKTT